MKIIDSLNDLLFPARCISCKVLGPSLCQKCRDGWKLSHYRTIISRGTLLEVRSSISYSNIASKVLLAAKESHLKRADTLIAQALVHSFHDWLRDAWIDTVIPVPSRKSATRQRGREFIHEIAQIAFIDSGVEIASILSHGREIRDQSGLHQEERWNNLAGAFVLRDKENRRNRRDLGKVLLVDDLITTGATLNEAARALRYAGIEVVGAVTAAIAQPVR